MPSLATLGALSARGFGQKIRKGGPTIQIKLWGAGGSSTWKDVGGCPGPSQGGAGGFVSGTTNSITQGELTIYVGGGGSTSGGFGGGGACVIGISPSYIFI